MKKNDLDIVDKQLTKFSNNYDVEQEEYDSLEAWSMGMAAQRERHRLEDEHYHRRNQTLEIQSRMHEEAQRAMQDLLVYGTSVTRINYDDRTSDLPYSTAGRMEMIHNLISSGLISFSEAQRMLHDE